MEFYKYHGTGNDFILVDNRDGNISLSQEQVAHLCHRRFGIGADGLMLLEHADGYDFRMVYYNSDGGESTMCGNGGRCITAFAAMLGLVDHKTRFVAIDGEHHATIHPDGLVSLHMIDVTGVERKEDHCILNTGSPHYVQWVKDTNAVNVFNEGKNIRTQPQFMPAGINVNFVQVIEGNQLKVRTYERGVEDETMSCGTGVTAAAIAASGNNTGIFATNIETPGGLLQVSFIKDDANSARDVILTGPAVFVFRGSVTL